VGEKLCPVDGNECTFGQVPQQCQCQCKKQKPGRRIRKQGEHKSPSHCFVEIGAGFKNCEEGSDDEDDGEREGHHANRDNGDSEGSGMPEFLFYVSGERKVPPCTVNPTEDCAKSHQEEDVEVPGILMRWNVKRRNVCGFSGEGS